MRQLKLIGIGAGNPDYITLQAINALRQVDVIFVTNKREDTAELARFRHQICERHMQEKPYRIVEVEDPRRDRASPDYRAGVVAWHEQRAALYEALLQKELCDGECGAFLIWGDPSLYDSAIRIVDQLVARRNVNFEFEIIPGITSVQALTARHRIPLNQLGAPVHITTGRLLKDEGLDVDTNIVVMLDGEQAFQAIAGDDIEIFWGAYLGTDNEILLSGKLGELREKIKEIRVRERERHGWIMDTYLLRKTTIS